MSNQVSYLTIKECLSNIISHLQYVITHNRPLFRPLVKKIINETPLCIASRIQHMLGNRCSNVRSRLGYGGNDDQQIEHLAIHSLNRSVINLRIIHGIPIPPCIKAYYASQPTCRINERFVFVKAHLQYAIKRIRSFFRAHI